MIVDTAYYEEHLPYSVEAIFALTTSPGDAVQHARDVHRGFLEQYGPSHGITADDVPLVWLCLTCHDHPFTLMHA